MPLGMEVGLSPGDYVFDGDPAPSTNDGEAPQFSAHLLQPSQTAAWIQMPLGTKVGLGPDNIVLDRHTAPLPKKGAEPPSQIFGPCLLWPNGWMDQDGTWHGGNPQSRRLCVRWGPRSPSFLAHVYCGQTVGWMKLVLGMKVGLSPGIFVLDGEPVPPPRQGGGAPKFSAHVYCGQMAGWIKMPLGTEVGLDPGDVMLDGDPAPLP